MENLDDKIAENDGESKESNMGVPINAFIEINIFENGIVAEAVISPPQNGGEPPTAELFAQALKAKGIEFGIDTEIINEVIAKPRYDIPFVIAKGEHPIAGDDAQMVMKVNIADPGKPTENPDGTVNFRDLGLMTQVLRGQVLCEKRAHTLGVAGKSIKGDIVSPTPGSDRPIPLGNNTMISEDGVKLISLIDGVIDYVSGTITVSKTFEVKGNVDVSTGDVNFDGNIVVSGNVEAGYKISATGSVDVFGMVEGAEISAGGDITVRGGVVKGSSRCMLISQGSINCKYLEGIEVFASKNLSAQQLMHCMVKCGNIVEMFGAKGSIIGGECICGGNVIAKAIGSPAHIRTLIFAGKDPTIADKEQKLKVEITSLTKALEDLERLEMVLSKLKNIGKLDPEKEPVLENVLMTIPVNKNKLDFAVNELNEIKQRVWDFAPIEIVVTGSIFPGSELRIGEGTARIDDIMRGKRFSMKDDIIIAR